jgi:hypothetical protein
MFTCFRLRLKKSSVALAGFLVLVSPLLSCGHPAEPAKRPSGVPADAVWAGGEDGGAYIQCVVDMAHNRDTCKVWNDYTGASSGWGDYRLVKENRAASASELKFAGAGGDSIYLQNGLVLTHQ